MMQQHRSAWREHFLLPANNHTLGTWLTDRGSLTQRLRSAGNFSLALLAQHLALPIRDEALELGLDPKQLAWIREVALFRDGQPAVFAHSVLPRLPRGSFTRQLSRLGNRPLGALFFLHPGFRRGPLMVRRLDRRHALFSRAIETLQLSGTPPTVLWARRSGFSFDKQTVLVTEVFSPEILCFQ